MQLLQELELIANELNGVNDLAKSPIKKPILLQRIKSQELKLNESMKWFQDEE